MGPDEQAIRELHSTWSDAVNAGDLSTLLSLMADDCLSLNPRRAPFGRDEFSPLPGGRFYRVQCCGA
jgi:uncharacterized protein (TIGR02246 family)